MDKNWPKNSLEVEKNINNYMQKFLWKYNGKLAV